MRSQILNPVSSLPTMPIMGLAQAPVLNHVFAKPAYDEETLVIDERASRRPAQAVEDKLSKMLETGSVGISHLRLKGLLSGRARD